MKKILIIPILLLVLTSCEKTSVSPETNGLQGSREYVDQKPVINQYNDIATYGLFARCGNWGINYSDKNGLHVAQDYSQLVFRFCPGNVFELSNENLSLRGAYHFIQSNNGQDYFEIDVNQGNQTLSPIWNSIQGVWKVKNLEAERIELTKDDVKNNRESLVFMFQSN